MKPIHERIRDMREDRDMKQKDIAKTLEISQQTYSNYENGLSELPLRHLVKLAEFYNVSTDYISGRTKYKGRIESFNVPYIENVTVGELLSTAMTLGDSKRRAVMYYIKFLETNTDF